MIVEIVSVVFACGFLIPGLYLEEDEVDGLWIFSVFMLPLLWLFSGRHTVIRFLINVAIFGSFFFFYSTWYFILSKAGYLRMMHRNVESWDDPYVFAFGMLIGLDVYFLAKILIRAHVYKSQSEGW